MPLGPDPDPHSDDDPLDQFRHDLKTPLTTISGRTQLLTRMVRRSSSLTELERGAMLDGLAIIEATVRAMVTQCDGMTRAGEKDGDEAR